MKKSESGDKPDQGEQVDKTCTPANNSPKGKRRRVTNQSSASVNDAAQMSTIHKTNEDNSEVDDNNQTNLVPIKTVDEMTVQELRDLIKQSPELMANQRISTSGEEVAIPISGEEVAIPISGEKVADNFSSTYYGEEVDYNPLSSQEDEEQQKSTKDDDDKSESQKEEEG